ncbi:NUDIX domain-containing protein [Tuwongella immobilis]|uniref:Nudix hydrolase domain-containing protein n=1 Tax=Tuwongella immobilis TaxID=692036 RepID=A0A6C2YQA2_9BACT|nr:NUDIX hydrolase [Tuwongella immobilis]VIP03349.1 nudix hydrolase : NUDIX hydrolase OS=Flavobacterium psychrophilum FPG101 GN=FPG101_06660 PE=4 SV=1: NUDIX [Tuwongella immobilis]VTS04070.1 nudix hydrolase : NUDIX hydrolase OS=Flavobacterium psychrophilum FPG101 GN=FPG101_06660 PE=4 SV=1: NUDIX [Tuwongella immobilis]
MSQSADQSKPSTFTYPYARPAVTVDLVIATQESNPRVLLIQRAKDPFAGSWALPGGFVDAGETLEAAARRELLEETQLQVETLQQFGAFGDPGRDPRGWTISIAFLTKIAPEAASAIAGDDAAAVGWFPFRKLPKLAFDHEAILTAARVALRRWRNR